MNKYQQYITEQAQLMLNQFSEVGSITIVMTYRKPQHGKTESNSAHATMMKLNDMSMSDLTPQLANLPGVLEQISHQLREVYKNPSGEIQVLPKKGEN